MYAFMLDTGSWKEPSLNVGLSLPSYSNLLNISCIFWFTVNQRKKKKRKDDDTNREIRNYKIACLDWDNLTGIKWSCIRCRSRSKNRPQWRERQLDLDWYMDMWEWEASHHNSKSCNSFHLLIATGHPMYQSSMYNLQYPIHG